MKAERPHPSIRAVPTLVVSLGPEWPADRLRRFGWLEVGMPGEPPEGDIELHRMAASAGVPVPGRAPEMAGFLAGTVDRLPSALDICFRRVRRLYLIHGHVFERTSCTQSRAENLAHWWQDFDAGVPKMCV